MYIPAKAKAQLREVALAHVTPLSHAIAEQRTVSSVGCGFCCIVFAL